MLRFYLIYDSVGQDSFMNHQALAVSPFYFEKNNTQLFEFRIMKSFLLVI